LKLGILLLCSCLSIHKQNLQKN